MMRNAWQITFSYTVSFSYNKNKIRCAIRRMLWFLRDVSIIQRLVHFSVQCVMAMCVRWCGGRGKLDYALHCSLLYNISCVRCASEHVSRTRISEHVGKSHRTGSFLSAPYLSNVMLHTSNCGMSINDSCFKIVSPCERNRETLLILESMFNLKHKPETNGLASTNKLLRRKRWCLCAPVRLFVNFTSFA